MKRLLNSTLLILFANIYLIHGHRSNEKSSNKNKLIIVLADGLRYDYFDRVPANGGLSKLIKSGVRADYVQPVFPTKSYPNWYTIATGLYVESHGMTGNYFYDPPSDSFFKSAPHNDSQLPRFWSEAEPIWATAERQGIRTAMFWWDGCKVNVSNVQVTHCVDYAADRQYWTWDPDTYEDDYVNASKIIINQFKDDNWQLAMIYYEGLDGE